MKLKLFSLLLVAMCFVGLATAGAQSWPHGKADYQTATIATDSTVSVDITNRLTYVVLPTINNNITIHLDVISGLQKGAFLIFELPNGAAAKTVTFGDKLDAPVLTGTISKTKTVTFLWDGTNYKKLCDTLVN
jgi:hypothetical protein